MIKSEFSETQFEAYHSRQIEKIIESTHHQYFPTRVEEGHLGVDMVHFGKFHNYFFQYKASKHLNGKTKKANMFDGNTYRIDIYNKNGAKSESQYRLLWEWAKLEPHVYFAAPMFNTKRDFAYYFHEIINHSAHFNLRNLLDPNAKDFDKEQHYIYFDEIEKYGFMSSEERIKVNKSFPHKNIRTELIQQQDFSTYLQKMASRIAEIGQKYNIKYEKEWLFYDNQYSDKNIQADRDRIEDFESFQLVNVIRNVLRNNFGLDWFVVYEK